MAPNTSTAAPLSLRLPSSSDTLNLSSVMRGSCPSTLRRFLSPYGASSSCLSHVSATGRKTMVSYSASRNSSSEFSGGKFGRRMSGAVCPVPIWMDRHTVPKLLVSHEG